MCDWFSRTGACSRKTPGRPRTLTITYGLRWEYNAAPSSPNGTLPSTVTQVNNFATMTLAPPGTPYGIHKRTISLPGSVSPGNRSRIWF